MDEGRGGKSGIAGRLAVLAGPLTVALLAWGADPAAAESLRCNGQSTSTGDSKVSVLQKCGEPMLKDTFCKPVMAMTPWAPYPVAVPPHLAPCELVDEWLYDRGQGNLFATVRFQRGVVDTIRYEGRP